MTLRRLSRILPMRSLFCNKTTSSGAATSKASGQQPHPQPRSSSNHSSSSNLAQATLGFEVPEDYDWTKSTQENYRIPEVDPDEGPYADVRATLDHAYHGHYDKSRQELQDTMIADVVKGGSAQDKPWLVFTAGPMGAGKSFVIKWMSKAGHFQLPSIVQIDPDCFRSRLPEWPEYLRRDAATAGARSHKECGYCVEIAQEVALRCSKNIWVDGSLRDSKWYQGVIQDIRKRYTHYRIGIIYVYASPSTVYTRAAKREQLTGRHVPVEELENSLAATPKAVEELSPLCDFVAWISNEGDDKADPKFTKMCDEAACRLLPGDEWEGIRNRFAPIEAAEAANKKIDEALSENDVVLFTKSYCSYCGQVKALFADLSLQGVNKSKARNFEFKVLDLDTIEMGLEIQVALSNRTGVTTTPQVFVRGEFIGGNSDVLQLHGDGMLEPKLKGPRQWKGCRITKFLSESWGH